MNARNGFQVRQQLGFAGGRNSGKQQHVGYTLLNRFDCDRARFRADQLAPAQLAREPRERGAMAISGIDGEY